MEPLTPSSPPHDSDTPLPAMASFECERIEYEEPLYTEINIPLPKLPAPPKSLPQASASSSPSTCTSTTATPSSPPSTSPPKHSRSRARSLSAFSFRSRSSSISFTSTSTSTSPSPRHSSDDSWPRIRPSLLKSRETAAAMNLNHANKRGRSGTVDALAVVPAVLVLSAELFTPGTGDGDGDRKGGSGRRGWGLVEGMR